MRQCRARNTRVVGCLLLGLALVPATVGPATVRIGGGVPVAVAYAAVPAVAPSGEPVRYYVVGQPVNGQKEYLFSIAAKTLGNGNRYMEIYTLNEGRPQPDGKSLTDPAVLEPGWILQLPPDAAGPGVQVGVLPTGGTPAHTQAAAPPRDTTSSTGPNNLERAVALVLMVALLGISLRLLRRGKRLSLPRPGRATDRPAEPLPAGVALSAAPAPARATPPRPIVAAPKEAPAVTTPVAVAPRVPVQRRSAGRGPDLALPRSPAPPPLPATPLPMGALGAAVFHAEVVDDGYLVAVRLAGVRGARPVPPHTWVADGARPPGGSVPVSLGRVGDSTLYVDLALAPDVITLTGPAPARTRLALDLAGQIGAAGIPVTIVGEPLAPPGDVPAGCAVAKTLDDVADATHPAGIGVVFYAPTGTDDQHAVRRLATRTSPRLVLVLVGDVQPARWSVSLGARTP